MKKLFFFFAMLASITASATVTITPISVDYPNKKVTFKVAWSGTVVPYNNRVWVWVDFCPITGAVPATSFSTATVSSPTITGGNGSTATSTARGFFIEYSSATNTGTTVTATLSNAPAGKFNWCAYGSDMPPNATVNAGGGYTLRGTPPFTINSSQTATSKTFGAGTCITSITDLTGRPDGFATPALTISTTNPAARCGAGAVTLNATASGGTTTNNTFTWIVDGGTAQTTTTGSLSLASVAVGSHTYSVNVNNANGCASALGLGSFTVHTSVAPATITGNTTNTCPAATLTLTASATGATSFTWYKNGSAVQSGTQNSYVVTSSGSYSARGNNTYCNGVTSATLTASINSCTPIMGFCSTWEKYSNDFNSPAYCILYCMGYRYYYYISVAYGSDCYCCN